MITRNLFITVIESIEQQIEYDKAYAYGMEQLFNCENTPLYDNSKIINSLIELLRLWFPRESEDHCELTHYCFVTNFKDDNGNFKSAGQLYDELTNKTN